MFAKTVIYELEERAIHSGYLIKFRTILSNHYCINYVLNTLMYREWRNAKKANTLGH